MDGIREFLAAVLQHGLVPGHLRGLFHIAIGRRISRPDGTVLSAGVTWRELAAVLKDLRFDKELVREVGADPESLSPRDRLRFWYSAIALARVDSAESMADAERLVKQVKPLGFVIGSPPTGSGAAAPPPPDAPKPKKPEPETKPKKKK